MARTKVCIFCGGVANSKEHVLRKKWRDYFGEDLRGYTEEHVYANPQGGPAHIESKKSKRVQFDYTVKAVCTVCNNGWMNDLENEVEQVLLRLFRGEAGPLSADDLGALTRWAAKTAFVIEAMDSSPEAAVEEQRHAVRHGMAPVRFNAFLLPLQPNDGHRFRSTPLYPPQTPEQGVLRMTTVHLHQLQIFTVTARDERIQELSWNLQTFYRRLGSPTWPPAELDWPSHEPLPIESVQILHDLMALAAPRTFLNRLAGGGATVYFPQ